MSRIWIGNLDPQVPEAEVQDICSKFGKNKVWVAHNPPGFAFVTYDDERDADDALRGLQDMMVGKQAIRVEFAKNKGRNGPPGADGDRGYPGGGGGRPPPRPGRYRAILKNLPPSFTWQELKDHMRRIGNVIYVDVQPNGDGLVEFGSPDDLDYAVRKLDGSKLEGSIITVYRDDNGRGGERGGPLPPPPPPPRYGDRSFDRRDDRRDRYDDRDRYGDRDRRDRGYDRGYDRFVDDRRDGRPPPGRHEDERPPRPRGDSSRRDDYGRRDDYDRRDDRRDNYDRRDDYDRGRGRNDRYND